MKINEIGKTMYDIFTFINNNEIIFVKKNIEKKEYKISKEDSKILKNIYKGNKLKIGYGKFLIICKNLTLSNKENIVISACKIVEIIKNNKL